MRVDEVGVAAARRAARAYETRKAGSRSASHGRRRRLPRDPVAVGDPEVAERRRRDDLDVHALRPHRLDGVADEQTGDVVLVARVRRRQDDDLHGGRRAKTIGAASASIANAKK